MNGIILVLSLFQSASFADDTPKDTSSKETKKPSPPSSKKKAKPKKKSKKGSLPSPKTKKVQKAPKRTPTTPTLRVMPGQKSEKKGNDASLNTIKPKKETHRQNHSTTIPKTKDDGTLTRKKRETILPGLTPKDKSKSKTEPTSSSATETPKKNEPKRNTTKTAIAATAAAAVGMGALALLPMKHKRIACPFNKAKLGARGGAQFSDPQENALGGGFAIGYRWCNPFAVEISYIHYGALESNVNSPLQGSVQMFLPSILALSPFLSGGGSVGMENETVSTLYGVHGGAGVQILFASGATALNLEGRYTQYLNASGGQNSQAHAVLGLDLYF